MPLLLALAASLPQGVPTKDPAKILAAPDGAVTARDIARTSPVGAAVVMTLPKGVNRVDLSETKRRELLRAAFPGGHFALRQTGTVRVTRRADRVRHTGSCFVAAADISQGTAIEPGDLAPAPCRTGAPAGALGYDAASQALLARRAMPAGSYLGPVPLLAAGAARRGSELFYRTSEGPVSVERKVVALQTARAGHRLFVRTGDGRVLVSTLAAGDGE